MTFSVPETLAVEFMRRVAPQDRSRFVSDALTTRLADRDLELIRACEAANQDTEVAEIEKEFEGIREAVAQPWK